MAIKIQKSAFSRVQAGNIGVISSADPSARERFDPSVMTGQDAGGRALMSVSQTIGEFGDNIRIARQKQELQDLDTEMKTASAAYREFQTKAGNEENGFNSLKGRNARNGYDAHLSADENKRLSILYGLSPKARKIWEADSLRLREDNRFRASAHSLRQDEVANLEAHKNLKQSIGVSISELPMATATPEIFQEYETRVKDYMALVFEEMERLGVNVANDPDGSIRKSIVQKHVSALNEPILQRMINAKDPVSALQHLEYATSLGHIDTETRNKFLPQIKTAAQTKAAQEGVDALLNAFGTTTQGRLSETQMLDRVKQYVKDNNLDQTVRDQMKTMIRLRYAAEERDRRASDREMGYEINRRATDTDPNTRVKSIEDLSVKQQNWLNKRPNSRKAFDEQVQRTADGTIQVTGGMKYRAYLINVTRSWINSDDGRKAREEFLAIDFSLPENTLNLGPGEAAGLQAFQREMQKYDSKAEWSAEIKTATERKKDLDAQKTMTRIERAVKSSLVGAELDAPVVAVVLNRVLRVASEAAEKGEILSDEQLLEISRGARRAGEFYEDIERLNGDGTISGDALTGDTNVLLMNFHAMQSRKKDMTSFFSSRNMLGSGADARRNRQLNEYIYGGTKNALSRLIPEHEFTREQILNHITKVEGAGKIPTRRTVLQNIMKEFKAQKETARIARAKRAHAEMQVEQMDTEEMILGGDFAAAAAEAEMQREQRDTEEMILGGDFAAEAAADAARLKAKTDKTLAALDAKSKGDELVADILRPSQLRVKEKEEELAAEAAAILEAKGVVKKIWNTPEAVPEVTGKIDDLIAIATQIEKEVTAAAAKVEKEDAAKKVSRGKIPLWVREKREAARKLKEELKGVKKNIDSNISVDEQKKLGERLQSILKEYDSSKNTAPVADIDADAKATVADIDADAKAAAAAIDADAKAEAATVDADAKAAAVTTADARYLSPDLSPKQRARQVAINREFLMGSKEDWKLFRPEKMDPTDKRFADTPTAEAQVIKDMSTLQRSIFQDLSIPPELRGMASLIADFEGVSQENLTKDNKHKVYRDGKDKKGRQLWSQGYGVRAKKNSQPISEEEARKQLVDAMSVAAKDVLDSLPLFSMNSMQLRALTSLVYNVGGTAWRNSDALKALQQDPPDFKTFRFEVEDSKEGFVKFEGKFNQGLFNRRKREMQIFFGENDGR